MHAELRIGTPEMTFHCALAKEQRLGDGRCGLSGQGQRDNLTFSPTQCLSAGRVTPRPRPGQGAGNEGLDGIEDLIGVAQPRPVVDSGHLDELSASDMRCEVAAIAYVHPLL